MISLHLYGRVAPGGRPDLEAFLAEARAVYEAPGGIRTRLAWDLTDPDSFVEIMEYADRATFDRDQLRVEKDPTMRALLARWRTLLVEGPQVRTYDEADLLLSPLLSPG